MEAEGDLRENLRSRPGADDLREEAHGDIATGGRFGAFATEQGAGLCLGIREAGRHVRRDAIEVRVRKSRTHGCQVVVPGLARQYAGGSRHTG